MAKIIPIIHKSNFRVIIEPRNLGNFGSIRCSPSLIYGRGPEAEKRMAEELQSRCEEIVSQVKRHVDEVGWVGIECDEEQQCPFCGYNWESACDENGEPGCCRAAIDAHAAT